MEYFYLDKDLEVQSDIDNGTKKHIDRKCVKNYYSTFDTAQKMSNLTKAGIAQRLGMRTGTKSKK